MSHFATPCIVVNLGCEMIYVIEQRLKAQNIPAEKSERGQMGNFISLIVVNSVGCMILLTGATWIAPILGFTKLGIAAGSMAASAHSWYGGCLGAGTIISLLMSRTMGP
ncbi:hypothetical protein MSG28_013121 [Choristoneura fumiferana]|uniref:Uncharacterized protein n=1 Tax=Choristoneura fumiferana TaxID=7141 RepID=A0ACC0KS53_CHOFU|nr:hypothetical protein MSG28_013121 [Choristoneura fumiferana]